MPGNVTYKIITLLLFVIWKMVAYAQISNPHDLEVLLADKRKYKDIVTTVQNYYQQKLAGLKVSDSAEQKKIKRQLKMWRRWEFFNAGRLDENGNITNVTRRDFEAMQEMQIRPEQIESASGSWTGIGPTAYIRLSGGHNGGLGRVNCIAFHPTDPNTLYLGTPSGGLWSSLNGGTNWYILTDDIPSIGVSGIVIHPVNPDIIYILTGDGDAGDRSCLGVMKTTDGGANWSFTGDFPSAPAVGFRGYKLLMHPSNSNILFAATSQGIYKTTSGGTNWTLVQAGWFSDIEFKPGDPTIMYAATMSSFTPLYRSTNSGDNWSTAGITGVPSNSTRLAIGVSNSNASYVYLLAGPNTGAGTYVGVYRSVNSGLHFDLVNSAPNILGYPTDGSDAKDQAGYDLAIEVNPANETNVITGCINVWRSTNSGVNFTNATDWYEPDAPVSKYVHADIHNLAYNPLNNWLYVCSDGGVSVSTDNGVTWTQKWNTLQIAQYYSMSNYEADQNKVLGGLQDIGTMFKKSASFTFDHVEGADGYRTLIDYTNSNVIYFTENDGLNYSTDGGTNVSGTGLSGGCVPALAMHSTNHNIVYAGRCDGVYKRDFSAGGWVNTGASGEWHILTCPSNDQRIYAYGSNGLFRSDNGTVNWTPTGPPVNPPSAQLIYGLAVNPINSLDLFVCVGGYTAGEKVYYSSNGGASWTNISGSLPNAACGSIAVDNLLGVYVGTDIGVFYRVPSTGVWVPFYNGLPKVPVTRLCINTAAGTLTASTYGRGLWRSDLNNPCGATLVLSGFEWGNHFYEVSDNITTTQWIQGGEGTQVYYKANNYVRMNPGFEVKAGSNMKAFIGNCGTGIPAFMQLSSVYGITDIKQLIKSPLDQSDTPVTGNTISSSEENGTRAVNINLKDKKFVQVYYERISDGEIIAWLIKGNIIKGNHKMELTDAALTGKAVNLVIQVGEEKQEIRL